MSDHDHRDCRPFGTGACAVELDTAPESYDLRYLDCYFDIDGQSNFSVAGQTAFSLTFNPTDQWFCPVAVSADVFDATDPNLERELFITGVGIDGCRQEGINTPTPTTATTQGWWTSKWKPRNRDGCACPVCWAPYSNTGTGSRILTVSGFSRYPAGITSQITINTYGRGMSMMPDVCRDVKDPVKPRPRSLPDPVPPVVRGGFVATPGGRSSAVPV